MIRHLLVITLLVFSLFIAGCDVFEARFGDNDLESRTLDNALLEHPATSAEPFTIPNQIVLTRSGKASFEAGFFNAGAATDVFVGGEETQVVVGKLSSTNTILCKDEKNYDYTLGVDSPTVSVPSFTGIGLKLDLVDNHGVTANRLTCTLDIISTKTSEHLQTAKLNVTMISE